MKVPVPFAIVHGGLGIQCTPLHYPQWICGSKGAYAGGISRLFYLPDGSLSIAVISNQSGAPGTDIWLGLYYTNMDVISSEIAYYESELVPGYTNPVKEIATFSSKEITSIEIHDMMGALIARRNSNKVDMSNLNPGMYFVIGFGKQNSRLYQGKIIKK